MSFIEGESRTQSVLFPDVLDDYIGEDNPVRFIDEYVESLNLIDLGFNHAVAKETGRPPYNPAEPLKLYIYGYLNRIRSSRKLEKATHYNVEVMWLLKMLQPDFKTIADFRKDNAAALKKVFKEFTLLCKKLDLFGGELIAIDGSKFSASNHNSRTYTKHGLREMIQEIEAKIDSYSKGLDQEDEKESAIIEHKAKELNERIKNLQTYKADLERLEQELEESGKTQISLTDPDSRKMHTGNHGNDVCYNVQMTVDEKHKLIVDVDVTNEANDEKQLYRMGVRAKEILGVETLTVTADTGFYNERGIKQCQDEGMTCYIPEPQKSQNRRLGLYTDKDFHYDATNDCYRCPAGEQLIYRSTYMKVAKEVRRYTSPACRKCALLTRCTRNLREGRTIYRWVHESVIEELNQRVKDHPEMIGKRRDIVEHPFGTIKRGMEQGYFLLRGFEKVGGEMSLSALAYNMKRVMNILGPAKLIKTVMELRKQLLWLLFEHATNGLFMICRYSKMPWNILDTFPKRSLV